MSDARGSHASSPLNMPPSSPAKSVPSSARRDQLRAAAASNNGQSSPLQFPPSSVGAGSTPRARSQQQQQNPYSDVPSGASSALGGEERTPRASASASVAARMETDGDGDGDEPLFFPSSSAANGTPRRAIRGELQNGSVLVSSPLDRHALQQAQRRRGGPGSTTSGLAGSNLGSELQFDFSDAPSNASGAAAATPAAAAAGAARAPRLASDVPSLSQAGDSTDPDAGADPSASRKVIWGTMVSINDTMAAFRSFLRGFRLKYRWAHERKLRAAKSSGNGHGNGNENDENDRDEGMHLVDHSLAAGEKLIYEGYLRTMRQTDQVNLNLRVEDLAAFAPSKKLAGLLQKYPQEVIPIMDQVLKDEMIELAEEDIKNHVQGMEGEQGTAEIEVIEGNLYKVRPFGLGNTNMRDLNPSDIDKLVTIRGLVIRATPIVPQMRQAFFRCLVCNHTVTVDIDRNRIAEPDRCPREVCNQVGTMNLIHNRSDFSDRQVVRLQETPDVVPDGQTPHTVSLCVYDELVDVAKPGDRVEITGIFRSEPTRVNPRARTQKSLFKTFLDTIHIKRGDKKRLGIDPSTRDRDAADQHNHSSQAIGVGGEDEEEEVRDADDETYAGAGEGAGAAAAAGSKTDTTRDELIAKLHDVSGRPDVYELLARSLAPSIYEMDDVKKGILLQLFGGTNKSITSGGGQGGPRYRGDINVLMVGDPGTSKSQILKYVHRIAPRGVYASGKGSSAVGLTAYVTRDPDTKQLVLESGALVLSDGGVCCIDEFDKMADATRSVLHEVMEQQTVSIAKAGIITTLNARTSVLAAANPIGSKYNIRQPITKNIDLPPTLISRFDLVYLVLDKIDEASDRRLARHLVSLYLEDKPTSSAKELMSIEMLTSYISYARNNISPRLTAEAADALANEYVELRRAGEDPRSSERRITATTRQLESMIRLSEAHARMRFSLEVEVGDVEEAARLIREAAKSSATDPVTGLIDLDLINTGAGMHQRKVAGDLRREFLQLLDNMGGTSRSAMQAAGSAAVAKSVRYTDLAKALSEQSTVPIDPSELYTLVRTLEAEGIIKTAGDRERRTVRKVIA